MQFKKYNFSFILGLGLLLAACGGSNIDTADDDKKQTQLLLPELPENFSILSPNLEIEDNGDGTGRYVILMRDEDNFTNSVYISRCPQDLNLTSWAGSFHYEIASANQGEYYDFWINHPGNFGVQLIYRDGAAQIDEYVIAARLDATFTDLRTRFGDTFFKFRIRLETACGNDSFEFFVRFD